VGREVADLDTSPRPRYLWGMEVRVAPELEAKLANLAAQQGRDPSELIQDVLTRYLEDETSFLEAVERGIAAAERGEFIEEAEMDARVARMFEA
jgi:predicted transcriptional regulator